MQNNVVSVDAAAAVMGVSKRTLWRWLSNGSLQRQGVDERGRIMLAFADVAPKLCVTFAGGSGDDLALLVAADRGDGEAQNELALLCLEQQRPDIALYWFQLAADQGHADAMYYMSKLYQQGQGVERCERTAMLWRVKAADAGHVIAQAQMTAITDRYRR